MLPACRLKDEHDRSLLIYLYMGFLYFASRLTWARMGVEMWMEAGRMIEVTDLTKTFVTTEMQPGLRRYESGNLVTTRG